MKNNRSIKYISFFIFMAILMSIFSLSVFATDEIQDEEDEELDYGELLNLTDDMYRKDDIDD